MKLFSFSGITIFQSAATKMALSTSQTESEKLSIEQLKEELVAVKKKYSEVVYILQNEPTNSPIYTWLSKARNEIETLNERIDFIESGLCK